MKRTFSALILCAFLTSSCNGVLDPRVAPSVQAAGAACGLIPPSEMVGPVSDEQICSAVVGLVSGVLKLFSATKHDGGVDAGTPAMEGVARNNIVIYVGPAAKAQHLRQKLESDTEFAAQIDAALAARK